MKPSRADIALLVASGGFAVSLATLWLYWSEVRVIEQVVLTPVRAQLLSRGGDEGSALAFDFAIANTGDRSARLVELCLLPRPWPELHWPIGFVGRIDEVVSGVSWLNGAGSEPHDDIAVGPGDLRRHQVLFDLSDARHWMELGEKDEIDLEVWATVLDHSGSHTSKVAIGLLLKYPNFEVSSSLQHTNPPARTELLPGYSSAPTPEVPGLCRFITPVFGPSVSQSSDAAL